MAIWIISGELLFILLNVAFWLVLAWKITGKERGYVSHRGPPATVRRYHGSLRHAAPADKEGWHYSPKRVEWFWFEAGERRPRDFIHETGLDRKAF